MNLAFAIILMSELYAVAGVAVALVFLTIGVGRVDPAATHAYAFRLLILPGVVLLWPMVLRRWRMLSRQQHGQR
jgi:hypothetical protein